jgi:hypothetical protein
MTAAALATIASIVALAAGVTFGLFSAATTPQDNSFTSGTVSLGTPVSVPCTVNNMVPGDDSTGYTPDTTGRTNAQTAACTFTVTYSGNVDAYIGLGLSASGGLYDGTANGLQFQVSDGTTSYTTGGVINTNTSSDPLFVSKDSSGAAAHTFTVNYALPRSAGNTYQNMSTTLTLTVYAVQAGNNGNGSCTAGQQCANVTSW